MIIIVNLSYLNMLASVFLSKKKCLNVNVYVPILSNFVPFLVWAHSCPYRSFDFWKLVPKFVSYPSKVPHVSSKTKTSELSVFDRWQMKMNPVTLTVCDNWLWKIFAREGLHGTSPPRCCCCQSCSFKLLYISRSLRTCRTSVLLTFILFGLSWEHVVTLTWLCWWSVFTSAHMTMTR